MLGAGSSLGQVRDMKNPANSGEGASPDRVNGLWWKVENLLRSTATFKDLGNALNTACTTNVRTKVAGTTADDCAQVVKAVKATQLTQNA